MAPSPPPTPPPHVQNAEQHLKQVLSLGDAQPYVIKIILSHLDHSYPDPHVIHSTLSPFISDPTPVVKSLFSHLNLPLCDERRRRPRTESEERYRQYRRERKRERRRRKDEYYRSRKRRHRDYDDRSPLPELDHPKRRRYASTSRDRDRDRDPDRNRDRDHDHDRDRSPLDRSPLDPSPLDRSREPSQDRHPLDRSPRGPIHDPPYGDRRRDRSPKKRTRDRSPRARVRDRSPRARQRDRSPRARTRDTSPDRRVRNRSPLEEHPAGDMSRRPWDNSAHTHDTPSSPCARNGPTSPLQEDGAKVSKTRGMLRMSSPRGSHHERRKENGNFKRGHVLADPGSSMDSKGAPKNSNKLRHLRSKVLASLSKPAEDGAAEDN